MRKKWMACGSTSSERCSDVNQAPCHSAMSAFHNGATGRKSLQMIFANLVNHRTTSQAQALGDLSLVALRFGQGQFEQFTLQQAIQQGCEVRSAGAQGPADGPVQSSDR